MLTKSQTIDPFDVEYENFIDALYGAAWRTGVIWITGNSGAGKTTAADELRQITANCIFLDGDDIRERMQGFSLTEQDRREHNLNVAKWAKLLADQDFMVIVSLICPYEDLRQQVKEITGCKFAYIEYDGDDQIPDKPYEKPVNPDFHYKREL